MFKDGELRRFLGGVVTTRPAEPPQETPEQVAEWRRRQAEENDQNVVELNAGQAQPLFNPTEAEAQLHTLEYRIDRLRSSINQRDRRHEAAIAQIQRAHDEETAEDVAALDKALANQKKLRAEALRWAIELKLFEGIETLELEAEQPPAITNEVSNG